MNDMTIHNGNADITTMSSREIAELTGKEHKNVMRDIRTMLTELHGEVGVLSFEQSYLNSQNKEQPCFSLPKRETLILVSGYSLPMRAKIIDRWQELEARPANVYDTLKDPSQMRHFLLHYVEKTLELEHKVEELGPKADAFDLISAGDDTMTATQVAKVLGMKRADFTARLHAEGWWYRQNESWVAYDRYIKNGCLQYKEAKYTDETTGLKCIKPYCHITPKGLAKLSLMFGIPANDIHIHLNKAA